MPIRHMSENQKEIIDALRCEICLADHREKVVLHEAEIAERYGVSRTPVRQVLQYLAHCLMVETQRGYGTVIKPLDKDNRTVEMNAFIAIARACALFLEGRTLDKSAIVEIVGLNTLVTLSNERSESEFVEINKRLVSVMAATIDDGLLRHAYTSAHWRVLRWRVLDVRKDPELNWRKLETGLAKMTETAMNQDASALLKFAAHMGGLHKTPELEYSV